MAMLFVLSALFVPMCPALHPRIMHITWFFARIAMEVDHNEMYEAVFVINLGISSSNVVLAQVQLSEYQTIMYKHCRRVLMQNCVCVTCRSYMCEQPPPPPAPRPHCCICIPGRACVEHFETCLRPPHVAYPIIVS